MRPTARRGLALLAALSLPLFVTGTALAGDYRTGESITIHSDETVADDLYAAGGTVLIEGAVQGDVVAAGGNVEVVGSVAGSVNATAGNVRVSGQVGGAVRSFSGNTEVTGSVGRDLVIFGGSVTVADGASIGGDLAGGGGTIVVRGNIEGNVEAGVGRLRFESTARVGGDVRYASENEAFIDPQAQIGGTIERSQPADDGFRAALPENPLVTFLGVVLGLLVLGWAMMLIRPGTVVGPGDQLRRRPLPALGIGLGGWIGQFVLVIALGILAALFGRLAAAFGGAFVVLLVLTVLAIIALVFLSQVYVAMAIGYAGRSFVGDRSPWLSYAIGALIWGAVLTLAGVIAGELGGLVFFIGWVLGIGALLLYQWQLRRTETWVAPAPAAQPPPPPAPPPAPA